MRDIKQYFSPKSLHRFQFHLLFWMAFICYEVSLAAAIRQHFSHFYDYLFHYALNIGLFYTHVLVVSRGRVSKKRALTAVSVLLEVCGYYVVSIWINQLLLAANVSVDVPDTNSRLFLLSVFYRCLYIIGLASAYDMVLRLAVQRRQIKTYSHEKLLADRETLALRTDLQTAEISFLRSQINPHFFFNSLNSVYNKVRRKDPNSAEYVMALADLMKYSLQPQSQAGIVSLNDELEHIQNYIKLQQMRYRTKVHVDISGTSDGLKIIPMLLITPIENVFQHGKLKMANVDPRIECVVQGGQLTLIIQNEINADRPPGNGVGLRNTEARLKLHYRDRYLLEYGVDQNIFHLKMVIQLE